MKFGRMLVEETDERYRHFYLNYKDLKQAIKLITGSASAAEGFSIQEVTHNFGNLPALAGSIFRPPESRFQDLLNHEKEKINKFMDVNLTATIRALKQLLKDLLKEDRGGSPADDHTSEDLVEYIEQCNRQAEMLIFLKSYQQTNITGFRKITKKYDKHNKSNSAHWYMAQLRKEAFVVSDFDSALKLLSLCSQIILALSQHSLKNDILLKGTINLFGVNNSFFVNNADALSAKEHTVYLLNPSNIMKVKVLLTKSLPLVSMGSNFFIGREAVDVLINPLAPIHPTNTDTAHTVSHCCMYFDTKQFDNIKEILNASRKQLLASDKIVTRVRWFGVLDSDDGDKDVYLERISLSKFTQFEEDFLTEESVAELGARRDTGAASGGATATATAAGGTNGIMVMLKYKHLNSMLTNSFDVDNWIRRKGRGNSIDKIKQLLNFVQQELSGGSLVPALQVWCHRTTFQLSVEPDPLSTTNTAATSGTVGGSVVVQAQLDECCVCASELEMKEDGKIAIGQPPECVITPYTKLKSDDLIKECNFAVFSLTHPANFRFPYPLNKPLNKSSSKEDDGGASAAEESGGAGQPSRGTSHKPGDFGLFDTDLESDVPIDDFKSFFSAMLDNQLHEAPDYSHLAHAAALLFAGKKTFKLQTPSWFRSTLVANDENSDQQDASRAKEKNDHVSLPRSGNYFSNGGPYSSKRALYQELNDDQPELLPAPQLLDQAAAAANHGGGGFLGLDATAIAVQDPLTQPLISPQQLLTTAANQATCSTRGACFWQRFASWFGGAARLRRSARNPRVREEVVPRAPAAAVRVEPKTFFANERTLLQWMNIAVLLSTISITLMTFGTLASRIAGFLLAPIAVFFILHSYRVYCRRTRALINKEPIDYVDRTGPLVLVVSLVAAVTAIVLLNILQAKPTRDTPLHSSVVPLPWPQKA